MCSGPALLGAIFLFPPCLSNLVHFKVSALPGPQRRDGGCQCLHRGLLGETAVGASQLCLSCPAPSRSGRADLAAIYHERIDVEGHHHGPSSPQRKDALKAVDTVLKYMTKWIQVTKNENLQANLPSRHCLPVSLTVTPLNIFLLADDS